MEAKIKEKYFSVELMTSDEELKVLVDAMNLYIAKTGKRKYLLDDLKSICEKAGVVIEEPEIEPIKF